jgi:hypothetical protein
MPTRAQHLLSRPLALGELTVPNRISPPTTPGARPAGWG